VESRFTLMNPGFIPLLSFGILAVQGPFQTARPLLAYYWAVGGSRYRLFEELAQFAGQDSYRGSHGNEAVQVRVHVTQMIVRHLNVKPEFAVDAKSLGGLLDEVDRQFHGFRDSICDESGKIRVYVNVFVNGENVSQDGEALSTPLSDGDELHILASVAGG
jgi:molybdopterin synthase sulfur carrier subunit